jgi:3-hydroxybutyryl-CoA dehydrogenase
MSHMHQEVRGTLAPAGINAALGTRPIHEFGQDRHAAPDAFPVPGADLLAGLTAQGRAVGRVGIIGANAVGLGIATSLLDAGIPVTLLELEQAALDSGIALARSGYQESDRRLSLLTGTVYFHHLKDCDLIVDALPATTAGKETLFRRLDQTAKPGAVMVTHAPDASVDHIAGCTRRRGEVLGLRVMGSSSAGAAWQIMPGKDTSGAALGTVVALAQRLHKAVAVCDPCHPIGTDVTHAAQHLDSVEAWKIDQALE